MFGAKPHRFCLITCDCICFVLSAIKATLDGTQSQSSYHRHDLPTLAGIDPLGADGLDGEMSVMHTPGVSELSLHPRDVDQTVRRIRTLVKRATEMVCQRLLRANVVLLVILWSCLFRSQFGRSHLYMYISVNKHMGRINHGISHTYIVLMASMRITTPAHSIHSPTHSQPSFTYPHCIHPPTLVPRRCACANGCTTGNPSRYCRWRSWTDGRALSTPSDKATSPSRPWCRGCRRPVLRTHGSCLAVACSACSLCARAPLSCSRSLTMIPRPYNRSLMDKNVIKT